MSNLIRSGVRSCSSALRLFGSSTKSAEKALINRVGPYILTCSGTALYSTFDGDLKIKIGHSMRQFDDWRQM